MLLLDCGGGHLKIDMGNIGALIIRIGFWGILYYTYNKEPPKPIVIIKAPTLAQAVKSQAPASWISRAWRLKFTV